MIDINDFNVLYDTFTCEILNKYRLVLNLKIKVYKTFVDADIYKTIVNTRRLLTNRREKMNPLIQMLVGTRIDFLEHRIVSDRLGLKKESDKDISDKLCYKLENLETPLNNISKTIPNTKKVQVISKNDGSSNDEGAKSENYRVKCVFDKPKSSQELFMAECELYFMEMIEERVGSVHLFLSF